jgi:hypothetical protein
VPDTAAGRSTDGLLAVIHAGVALSRIDLAISATIPALALKPSLVVGLNDPQAMLVPRFEELLKHRVKSWNWIRIIALRYDPSCQSKATKVVSIVRFDDHPFPEARKQGTAQCGIHPSNEAGEVAQRRILEIHAWPKRNAP